MSFDLWNRPLKIWESTGTPTPEVGAQLGSVGVHSRTFSYIPESMKSNSWASLLARIFASPCLGREPKTKVVT